MSAPAASTSPADRQLPVFKFKAVKEVIPLETLQQFIVEYATLYKKTEKKEIKIPFGSLFGLGGVLQPYVNQAAHNIGQIIKKHNCALNAFICYKWPGDEKEKEDLQREIKLMRTLFRGAGLAATMDIVDNNSGTILSFRQTLKETDVIIVLITEKFINSALNWKTKRAEQAELRRALDPSASVDITDAEEGTKSMAGA